MKVQLATNATQNSRNLFDPYSGKLSDKNEFNHSDKQ